MLYHKYNTSEHGEMMKFAHRKLTQLVHCILYRSVKWCANWLVVEARASLWPIGSFNNIPLDVICLLSLVPACSAFGIFLLMLQIAVQRLVDCHVFWTGFLQYVPSPVLSQSTYCHFGNHGVIMARLYPLPRSWFRFTLPLFTATGLYFSHLCSSRFSWRANRFRASPTFRIRFGKNYQSNFIFLWNWCISEN